jgi:hypothetical protein
MTSKELKNTLPLSIDVNETGDEIIICMPLAPFDCTSESGKMNVLCTTNGWQKTQIKCPRTGEIIQVNIFVGTRA